jgi:tetratricopeptide (TPR) repeat protein
MNDTPTQIFRFAVLAIVALLLPACQRAPEGKSPREKAYDYAAHELYEDSIKEFTQVLQQAPEDIEVRYNIGVLHLRLGQFEAAEKRFGEVLRNNPAHAMAHNNLGVIAHSDARFAEAASHFERAIGSNSELLEAHINLGLTLRSDGKVEQSRLAYQHALSLDPENALAREGLQRLSAE